ncbi:MAG: right-handed parallel beta-helix repeat-containing protein, partial [Bryobacteraceae bacterium]
GRNAAGRNNATGGILIEEGSKDFQVVNSVFRRIRGNAVWTHSLYRSARNGPGSIADNRFEDIGRDAVQVGHASAVRVERNVGRRIGYPFEEIDVEGGAVPVGIDTAGNVDRSVYSRNRFEEVNGKCIDLDGFHNGEVRSNVCVNRGAASDYPSGGYAIVMNNTNPDMRPAGVWIEGNEIDGARFGGIFVIGASNRVTGNTLRNLNLARCTGPSQPGCDYAPDQPDLLRSGIYLGRGAERPAPAEDNEIRANHISGFRLENRCVAAAPGVSLARNQVSGNTCRSLP